MKPAARTLLALLAIFGSGCPDHPAGPDHAAGAAVLDPVPLPALDGADAAVQRQLLDARERVDALASGQPGAPQLAQAFTDLGLLYVAYEFLEPAAVCFTNARRLAPDDSRWHYLGGYVAALQGDLAAAVGFYERALELRPDDLPTLLRSGRVRLQLGDHAGARRDFERALAIDPAAAAAAEGLGRTAAALGDAAAAARHLERALALEPEASALHYSLGQAYRDLGDLERARAHLESAGDVPARIRDPLIAPLAEAAESSQFYLVQGAEALEDYDLETAATAFMAALERDAASFEAYRGLALSLERLGDLDGASATLERALEHATKGDPDQDRRMRAETLRLLGALDARAGREGRAMERFEASLALEPEQPAVLLAVANARARQGRLVEALAIYDRLLEIGPESPPAILEKRAVVLVNLGRGEEAIAAFEQAVAAAPNDLALRQRFVEALEFLGQAQRAAAERAALAPLERSGGESTDVLVREAFRLREEGRNRDAIERYRRALAHSPQRSDARFGLASLLLDMGDHAGAADEFRQLLEEAPRHAAARRGRVLALVLDGRYPVARAELQEALRLFPRDRELALMQVRLLASAPDPRARDGALALEIARLVHDDDRGETTREALALAYAAAGDFEEAVALQQVLVAEADRAGTPAVAESRRARLAAFQRSQTWQARSPEEIAGGVRP